MMTKAVTVVMLHKTRTYSDRVQCNIRTWEHNAEMKRHEQHSENSAQRSRLVLESNKAV
jgi:hypothetical protein